MRAWGRCTDDHLLPLLHPYIVIRFTRSSLGRLVRRHEAKCRLHARRHGWGALRGGKLAGVSIALITLTKRTANTEAPGLPLPFPSSTMIRQKLLMCCRWMQDDPPRCCRGAVGGV